MKTKEEILEQIFDENPMADDISETIALELAERYGKEVAMDFLKWNMNKIDGYVEYIQKVKPKVISKEIEDSMYEFEGAEYGCTLEHRYELYLKSKEMDEQNKLLDE